ncbi:MAG: Sec-independent protein translocase protein TatB [Acinetobacter populi]|uniref:Sec-independent protein translocase protein TatB n=1 Tax=Acinetobacter populi TaxID=1582270 RepID=UPI0023537C98|nr:Sec-independent protein translocase protein TatB [Acinetobacter populi]MCH4247063.1 Sec-independent protein translocase protein TatB [Acinetobacter populi]
MLNVGMSELLLFAVVALIVLGPEQLPQALRNIIKFYRKLKKITHQLHAEIEKELQISELQALMKHELAEIQAKEQQMQQQLDQLHQEIADFHRLEKHAKPVHYLVMMPLAPHHLLKTPYLPINHRKRSDGITSV